MKNGFNSSIPDENFNLKKVEKFSFGCLVSYFPAFFPTFIFAHFSLLYVGHPHRVLRLEGARGLRRPRPRVRPRVRVGVLASIRAQAFNPPNLQERFSVRIQWKNK